ncbi:PREDICTED: uncharacterized protein LOC105368258 [Ceratosolen solmsi marchali]|uniref:Uncharacterized protein LOC105368258 n=1 Tax=Ceratosolen solmsi marchali TaxID=326594 RepID=A0AAJ7E2K9_9HYME|nr:PREDICTED: uncharacterized protein LOC105368258 [Ceratosolen solmsi marchali]
MTVMLLQRSATPQLTYSQKTADNNNSNEPPFLILLDIQEHTELECESSGYDTYSNNININNTDTGESTERKNVAIIGRSSTCGSASACGAGGAWNKSPGSRGGPAPGSIAMRYYRLWIYACNIVLLGSAVGFAAAVSRTLLFSGDPRRYLVPGVPRAYDPTALYAYLALAVQLGLVQLLGCIAARRLSAKLLNAYWLLLLALLFGDAVIGVAWVFRFERMRADLRPSLRLRLQVEYSKETRFSEQWDQLQREFSCCGITGPLDFDSHWPQSCCSSRATISTPSLGSENNISDSKSNNLTSDEPCQEPHSQGCEEQLVHWLRKTADLLFVLGFCVIAFTKLCFLGILRYEIREMIQKIRLLKEPPPATVPFQQLMEIPINNGNIARRTTLPIVTTHSTPGTTALFVQTEDCTNSKHPLLGGSLQDGGADSDTNSHCALILEESTPPAQHHSTAAIREKSNGNNNYEMCEFNRRLLFSNGNNTVATTMGNPSNGSSSAQATTPSQQFKRT